jgi:hypothetical protein
MKNNLSKLAFAVVCLTGSIGYDIPNNDMYLEDSDIYSDVADSLKNGWNWGVSSATATERIEVHGTYTGGGSGGWAGGWGGWAGGSQDTTGGDQGDGDSIPTAEEQKKQECADKTRQANSDLAACNTKLAQEAAITHQIVCLEQNSYEGSFSVGIASKVVSALLGASVTTDDYTKCKNQLDYNVAAVAAKCTSVHASVINEACKGV